MQNYKRNVTYFYQYHNGKVGTTAGFLKMEIRGDKVKITINIQESSHGFSSNPALCFYHETGDSLTAVKVDEVERIDGVLTYQNRTLWQRIFDTERDLYTFDGVLVLYSDNDYYLGDFGGRDRSSYSIKFQDDKKKKEEVNISEEIDHNIEDTDTHEVVKDAEEDRNEEEIISEENPAHVEGSIDDMLKKYPKLPLYGSIGLSDCVRIQPKDIGKLDIGNWKLGSNSFLSHGYYIYKYLLLGKMRFDDGIYHMVIGVPGVYSNRERYMANMFGFDQFVPVKSNGTRTGEFGYWIVEVRE